MKPKKEEARINAALTVDYSDTMLLNLANNPGVTFFGEPEDMKKMQKRIEKIRSGK